MVGGALLFVTAAAPGKHGDGGLAYEAEQATSLIQDEWRPGRCPVAPSGLVARALGVAPVHHRAAWRTPVGWQCAFSWHAFGQRPCTPAEIEEDALNTRKGEACIASGEYRAEPLIAVWYARNLSAAHLQLNLRNFAEVNRRPRLDLRIRGLPALFHNAGNRSGNRGVAVVSGTSLLEVYSFPRNDQRGGLNFQLRSRRDALADNTSRTRLIALARAIVRYIWPTTAIR